MEIETKTTWENFLEKVINALVPDGFPRRYSYADFILSRAGKKEFYIFSYDVGKRKFAFYDESGNEVVRIEGNRVEIQSNRLVDELKRQGIQFPESRLVQGLKDQGIDASEENVDAYKIVIVCDENEGPRWYCTSLAYEDDLVKMNEGDIDGVLNGVYRVFSRVKRKMEEILDGSERYLMHMQQDLEKILKVKTKETDPEVWKRRSVEQWKRELLKAFNEKEDRIWEIEAYNKAWKLAKVLGGYDQELKRLVYGRVSVRIKSGNGEFDFGYFANANHDSFEEFWMNVEDQDVTLECLNMLEEKLSAMARECKGDKRDGLMELVNKLRCQRSNISRISIGKGSYERLYICLYEKKPSGECEVIEKLWWDDDNVLIVTRYGEEDDVVVPSSYHIVAEPIADYLFGKFRKSVYRMREIEVDLDYWLYRLKSEKLLERLTSIDKRMRDDFVEIEKEFLISDEPATQWMESDVFNCFKESCMAENDREVLMNNTQFFYYYDKNRNEFVFYNKKNQELITNVRSVVSAMFSSKDVGKEDGILKAKFAGNRKVVLYTADKLGSEFEKRTYSLKAFRAIRALVKRAVNVNERLRTWVEYSRDEIKSIPDEGVYLDESTMRRIRLDDVLSVGMPEIWVGAKTRNVQKSKRRLML